MKKFIALLLVTVFAFTFFACSVEKKYKDDVLCSALSENASKKVSLDSAVQFMRGDTGFKLSPSTSAILSLIKDDYVIMGTGGASCDEYGIIHVKSGEDVKKVESAVKDYLKEKAENETDRSYYDDDYKLDESEVKIFGNYVTYAILTKENRTAFFDEIDGLLWDT